MVTDQAAAAPAEESGPVPRGRTVLLVEDEALVRHTTAGMLGSLGLGVMAAATPSEAVALAQRADLRIDLLLTDVVMPEQSGKALRDRVLALRPGLPVIFMSGYTPNVIVRHGVLEQGVRFLQKPFSLAELAAALRQALAPG
jgi:CheY-like chemotaxis protein